MPTYEYACTECGERLEVVQSFSDDPLTICPACQGKLRKLFSAVGVVFKGAGFYKTDSRSGKPKTAAASTADSGKAAPSTTAANGSDSAASTTAGSSSDSSSDSSSTSSSPTPAAAPKSDSTGGGSKVA